MHLYKKNRVFLSFSQMYHLRSFPENKSNKANKYAIARQGMNSK